MGIRAAAVVEEEAAGALFPLDAATLHDSSGHSSAAPKMGMQASDAAAASAQVFTGAAASSSA